MTWNTNEKKVKLVVRDTTTEVSEDANFSETIRKAAIDAGLARFSVEVDGLELEPHEAPSTFAGVGVVKLTAYNKAG